MSHYMDSYIFFIRNKKWNFMGNEIWIQNMIRISIVCYVLADRFYEEIHMWVAYLKEEREEYKELANYDMW